MVQRRIRRAKQYGRRRRPKTPAPTNGWRLSELSVLTGFSETTLRYYVQQDIIEPLEFRGTVTRYSRSALLRLLGIRRLKSEGKLALAEMKRRVIAMGDAALEAWVAAAGVPAAAATALGLSQVSARGSAGAAAATASSAAEALRVPATQWQRITLLPGLELMLCADALPAARLAAQRICDEYVVR